MKKIDISTATHKNVFTLVDNDDYKNLINYNWYAVELKSKLYAKCYYKGKNFYMHRLVMKAPKGKVVDHIFHNTLDNRKKYLRICSYSQNTINSKKVKGNSKYKGVRFVSDVYRKKPWCATVWLNSKATHVGYYKTEQESALAYNIKAKELHGEFAYENRI